VSAASDIEERLGDLIAPMSQRETVIMMMTTSSSGRFDREQFSRLCAAVLLNDAEAREQIESLIDSGDFVVDENRIITLGSSLRHLGALGDTAMATGAAHWDGEFSVYIAEPRLSQIDYDRVTRVLSHGRFGLLQEGCWMRPSNLPNPFDHQAVSLPTHLHSMRSRMPYPRSLVSRLWDLAAWSGQAELLVQLQTDSVELLETVGPDGLRTACLVGCASIRITAEDPLLPPALAPPGWMSSSAHSGFHRLEQLTNSLLAKHLSIRPV
jgi:phenylacetic acid degradation operon negative regulatory protein